MRIANGPGFAAQINIARHKGRVKAVLKSVYFPLRAVCCRSVNFSVSVSVSHYVSSMTLMCSSTQILDSLPLVIEEHCGGVLVGTI